MLSNQLMPEIAIYSFTSINAAGTASIYSTYLGANKDDEANAIALDSAASAYVVGVSLSGSFPKTLSFQKRSLAFQPAMKGKGDAIVAKIALRTFVKTSPKNLAFQAQAVGTTSPPLKAILYVVSRSAGEPGPTARTKLFPRTMTVFSSRLRIAN